VSGAGMSLGVILLGAVLLLLGARKGGGGRNGSWLAHWQRCLTVSGLALLMLGAGIRIASLSPAVGACPGSSGPNPPHCFHGAPWPPHGTSR
jgi:hypothetical protein